MKRSRYQELDKEKLKYYQMRISYVYPQFEFYRCQHFLRDGIDLSTGIFLYQGAYFVFLPESEALLGWDDFLDEEAWECMDEVTLDALWQDKDYIQKRFDCSFAHRKDLKTFLQSHSSPIRKAHIPAMLVEVNPRPLEKTGIYALSALKEMLAKENFQLPNEDQWEFFCGENTRTIFPWGDRIDLEMDLSTEIHNRQLPNHFGLSIAFDPALRELVDTVDIPFKGGDGGSAQSFGCGQAMQILQSATALRHAHLFDEIDLDNLPPEMMYRRVFLVDHNALSSKLNGDMN